jgi:serine/threonine-protein kinase
MPALPTSTPTLGLGDLQVYTDTMVGVYVPAGDFLMGSTEAEITKISQGCWRCNYENEKPQHTVYLDAYWIDQTDVTNAMFAQFVSATLYKTDAEKAGAGSAFNVAGGYWTKTAGADWQHPRGPSSTITGQAKRPVVQVSWNDAKAYCEWAGRQLPTEAQWEKAARGADGKTYPWGNYAPNASVLDFYNLEKKDIVEAGRYTFGASPYRALDMAGNVNQWVADWYSDTYYASSPSQNPTGPASGTLRTQRGSSWWDDAQNVRVARRAWRSPEAQADNLGFRCARLP